jgi:hypothetical protein
MNDEYTVDYNFQYRKWCVYIQMTASIRVVHQECEDKAAAEKLAERLNGGN